MMDGATVLRFGFLVGEVEAFLEDLLDALIDFLLPFLIDSTVFYSVYYDFWGSSTVDYGFLSDGFSSDPEFSDGLESDHYLLSFL